MGNLPNDPIMLMSVINTKLRDFYPTLKELCDTENIDILELTEKLKTVDFAYNEQINQFR